MRSQRYLVPFWWAARSLRVRSGLWVLPLILLSCVTQPASQEEPVTQVPRHVLSESDSFHERQSKANSKAHEKSVEDSRKRALSSHERARLQSDLSLVRAHLSEREARLRNLSRAKPGTPEYFQSSELKSEISRLKNVERGIQQKLLRL
jgi:hypothetical protein